VIPCRNDLGFANLKTSQKDSIVFKALPLSLQALTSAHILPGLFQPAANEINLSHRFVVFDTDPRTEKDSKNQLDKLTDMV
jgi:hypothetical protein